MLLCRKRGIYVFLDICALQESFYHSIKEALDRFVQTGFNTEVYALVFDCDSDGGQICLRYANTAYFNESLKDFEQYKYMFGPYGKYGLRGYKYSVGDFPFIDFEYSPQVQQFLDTYYYYDTGDYCGEGAPIAGLEETYKEIWKDMILSCIRRLKGEYRKLRTTDDFIIFMCDHDQSDEDTEEWIKWTVDSELFSKLLNDSYL